jgi:DNA-binding GntR family transcriptional regulator
MQNKPEKKENNLMEKAYREIKSMIFQQMFGPGQKLIYRTLAERLNMSKTPIMYALGRLEQEGFVELIPNFGYSVKEIDIKELEDLFDIREALEVHAVFLAIKNHKDEDLENLEKAIQKHKEYKPPVYDRLKLMLDANVHLEIAKMSGNKVLIRHLRQLYEHTYLRHRVELMNPTRMHASPKEHLKILGLIRERNTSEAMKLIRAHIRAAKENMISSHYINLKENLKERPFINLSYF